jgi:hypothetical protein
MLTFKPLVSKISFPEKIWLTFTKCCEKNVLCEKGDEITRFDGNRVRIKGQSQEMDGFYW